MSKTATESQKEEAALPPMLADALAQVGQRAVTPTSEMVGSVELGHPGTPQAEGVAFDEFAEAERQRADTAVEAWKARKHEANDAQAMRLQHKQPQTVEGFFL